MATRGTPSIPMGEAGEETRVTVRRTWRMRGLLSSSAQMFETFLAAAQFDRGPWLTVAFACGIGLWFYLAAPWQWLAVIGGTLAIAVFAFAKWKDKAGRAYVMVAVVSLALALAAGASLVWARSAMVGAGPIPHPRFERIDGRILEREEQPAENRVRLTLAARDIETGRAMAYRVNVPLDADRPELREGARVRLSARLMPPSPPIVPGAYNFARRAWFEGLVATGSAVGDVELVEPPPRSELSLASIQRRLSAHVRDRLGGTSGAIAATLASGDRGAIPETDEEAMRDAGLTHLLSISGLHVSAIIAATYLVTLKLLALWPWLTLRVRLPLVAAVAAAMAGIGYTLLTGAEVPTVRSCIGALLVLIALALGREPLSMRMVAIAAGAVLALWPESLVGPSFQMSFAAVMAIVALHNVSAIRDFLAPRQENWLRRVARRTAVLFLTGLVIELALMPIVLFHFHRAGVYGAVANLVGIPLVTFVSMPLVALALALDLIGAGAPAWWLVGKSLDLLLGIAHFFAEQPGAVKLAPRIGMGVMTIYLAGALWLALWQGKTRLLGLVPISVAAVLMLAAPVPDILITRDGRDIGIANETTQLLVLRDSEGGYAQDNLLELGGTDREPIPIADWPQSRCSAEFCVLTIRRDGRDWSILIARNRDLVEERALAAACARADIAIADRYLPYSCRPRWLKADRRFLDREGGAAIHLASGRVETVAQDQGKHGWWRAADR
ncbi:ComEC/Rec2 family competence protein [Qipengyuania qiaonensis]|uniref:ComEC family competence protein n=1 Tax=Qipengyuania qiaonensis TaxID=2867240 RepID=A0ABS7J542_9SPHN|nr:ComEC/Rec2 family competence protein [Qipengyuania qiaonensis]MBX7481204.1 ComEC family competence protein [Qipengyuania qiaonensis]